MEKYVSTLVNGTFIISETMAADSQTECVAACHIRSSCSVIKFTRNPNSCNGYMRNADELGWVVSGGVQVMVESSRPSKNSINCVVKLFFRVMILVMNFIFASPHAEALVHGLC